MGGASKSFLPPLKETIDHCFKAVTYCIPLNFVSNGKPVEEAHNESTARCNFFQGYRVYRNTPI